MTQIRHHCTSGFDSENAVKIIILNNQIYYFVIRIAPIRQILHQIVVIVALYNLCDNNVFKQIAVCFMPKDRICLKNIWWNTSVKNCSIKFFKHHYDTMF